MRLNLRPYAQFEESLPGYLDYNFKRITDVLEQQDNIVHGTSAVTGSLILSTGLAQVENVVATLRDAPIAGGCFVRAQPVGTGAGDITLSVYKSDFSLSVVAVSISWLAAGTI